MRVGEGGRERGEGREGERKGGRAGEREGMRDLLLVLLFLEELSLLVIRVKVFVAPLGFLLVVFL